MFCFDTQHKTSPRLRRIARYTRVDIDGIVALGRLAYGDSEILDFLVLHEPGAAAAPPSGGKRSLRGKPTDEKIAGVARRRGCSVEARMTWVPGVISPKEGPLTCATAGMSNGSALAPRFAPTASSCTRAR